MSLPVSNKAFVMFRMFCLMGLVQKYCYYHILYNKLLKFCTKCYFYFLMLCMHIVETLYWLHYKAHDQLSWCTKGSANIKPLPELGFELWSPSTKDNG